MPKKKGGRGRGQSQLAQDVPVPDGRGREQSQLAQDVPVPGTRQPTTQQMQQPPTQRMQQPTMQQAAYPLLPTQQATHQQAPVQQAPQQQAPTQRAPAQQVPAQVVQQQPPNQQLQNPSQIQQGQQAAQPAQACAGARPRVPEAPIVQTPSRALVSGGVGCVTRQLERLHTRDGHDFPLPQVGTLGRKIALKANHYRVDLPRGSVYHYDIDIRAVKKNGAPETTSSVPKKGVKPSGVARKLNPTLCRKVIELLLVKYKLKSSHWPAYDGNKNMYTRKRLDLVDGVTLFEVSLFKVPGDPKSEDLFQVTIKPVEKEGTNDCEVSLELLHQLIQGHVSTYPEEAIHALDIILRYGPSLKFVPVGRSFFMKPSSTEEVHLEEGRSIWFGYHQSLRPGWKPLPNGRQATTFYLNIDKAATAFLKPINLVDFSLEILHLRAPPVSFTDSQIKDLSKKLRNIQVKALHLHYPTKYKIVRVLHEKANTKTFEMDNKQITVEKYFREKYKKTLKYPNYPCVQVGNPDRKVYLPMELCEVMDDQPSKGKLTPNQAADMMPHTAIPPKERFQQIENYVKLTKDTNADLLKTFEINISTDPIQFQGRVLQAPSLEYNKAKAPVRDGQWEMRGKSFVAARNLEKWVVLSLSRTYENDVVNFVNKLRESGHNQGMTIALPCAPPGSFGDVRPGSVGNILREYKTKFPDLQLAFVFLPKNSVLYKELKHEGETIVGLITQCVTDENMRKCKNDKFSFRFLMNICQKMNAKLGGTNVSLHKEDKPAIFKKPVIVIGADVTHPAPGVKDGYSIAACVGSVDSYPARYVTKVLLQKVRDEVRAREERILDLNLMIKDLLLEFNKATKHKPERIVFFRDGVSEGQFLQVRDYEIHQIRQACTSLEEGYEPKISFIVVQKRHHTRFAPQNFKDGMERYNYNVPAGTTVDTEITHPSYFNFFLASHVALQGTTRPAHYTVLWDDNDFTADILQKFVFYLCHTYNRCTRSISIPPPVMYADLAAYRAKLYIDATLEKISDKSGDSDSSNESILPEIINAILTTDNVKNEMYFV